jgi:hypothetical protein
LDRAAIEDAFRRLGDRLARRGVVADLYIFGGAAMPWPMTPAGRRVTSTPCSSRMVSCLKRPGELPMNSACLTGGSLLYSVPSICIGFRVSWMYFDRACAAARLLARDDHQRLADVGY